jgi:hemolysin III
MIDGMPDRAYPISEEIANAVSHGSGAVASLIGIPILIAIAVPHGAASVIGASVFGVSILLLYLASTLYHALTHAGAKRVFKVIDHSAIYLLIAGTYTPFTLTALPEPWGRGMLIAIWSLAIVGIAFKSVGRLSGGFLSTALYLAMGWLVIVAIRPLALHVPPTGIALLIGGGLFYTLGVVFFALEQVRWCHFVWHLFVLAGSACHYTAVLRYGI